MKFIGISLMLGITCSTFASPVALPDHNHLIYYQSYYQIDQESESDDQSVLIQISDYAPSQRLACQAIHSNQSHQPEVTRINLNLKKRFLPKTELDFVDFQVISVSVSSTFIPSGILISQQYAINLHYFFTSLSSGNRAGPCWA